MREVIAVCRSSKRARDRVARVFDRYFWRIGDRTWRGNASNACLDRVSRELRKRATRNTAVVIHEIRSAHESRVPIIRIGARYAFSDAGIAPIASRPMLFAKARSVSSNRAVVQIAALFHDLGKATNLFQKKLQLALSGDQPRADPVRHELFSVAVWDHLFGTAKDEALSKDLLSLLPEEVDSACDAVREVLAPFVAECEKPLRFDFLEDENSLSYSIAMLILTHHRLPDGDSDLLQPLASAHARTSGRFSADHDLRIASGTPFWHEEWWLSALRRNAELLTSNNGLLGLDVFLRSSLMMADHLGSSQKKSSNQKADHLANTTRESGSNELVPADSLNTHVRRVYSAARHGVDIFELYADRFPALDEGEVPTDIAFPAESGRQRFRWQYEASVAARSLCKTNDGGFFACLTAGTGTGKTRGAPTILAAAAFGDVRPERRYFRMSLGLGLRVLASQSAKEYVSDLGFSDQDVSVLVGQPPLAFVPNQERDDDNFTGLESLIKIPDWLRVEVATGGVPDHGDAGEENWLRSLSLNTERGLPAFCEKFLQTLGSRENDGRRLLVAPIMVGTIDHLMGVASPINSRYLLQSLRIATADLILDEIDQFSGEDIAAIGRLVYQTAVAGRRVIVMSATLTPEIARALYAAYHNGWTQYAAAHKLSDHVNILATGDAKDSCRTNVDGDNLDDILEISTKATIQALAIAKPARRAAILPACDEWQNLVDQIDDACHCLHDLNAVDINGFRVSFGMIRLTRISHTSALAAQLPSGKTADRLRMKLCLHAQFPRLIRSWIETRLKQTLTRKCEQDPNAGIRELCDDEDIFARASMAMVSDVEIVLITSPVIETGNDLDFDWAILDPISTRSVVQTAGRVCRHRIVFGDQINVMILGRSPIAIQTKKLDTPGVEAKLDSKTRVPTPSLSDFEGRLFKDLCGTADCSVIDSALILARDKFFPLRDQEIALCEKLIAAGRDSAEEAPLGRYIRRIPARMTQQISHVRQFRRSEAPVIQFRLVGEDLETAEWHRDLSPGTRDSDLQPVKSCRFDTRTLEGCHLFQRVTARAWADLSPDEHLTRHRIGNLMQVEIDDYLNDIEPRLAYNDFTGFSRGSRDDILAPFGKVI